MIRNRYAIIAILTGLNLLNYLDRYVLAAIGEPMKHALGFNDEQLGLIGQAFLISYLVTSPIFGRLGDVFARKVLITGGVLVWSVATVASGFTSTFWPMWGTRTFVGVGEASYASLSPTVLDDITPPTLKGRILAIFYSAIPIGSALGYLLGGYLEKALDWRWAFFIAGAPGAVLALLCLAIEEPARHVHGEGTDAHAPVQPGSLARDLGALLASPRYVWSVIGFTAQTFGLGGFSYWAPKLLVRTYNFPNDQGNMIFGGIVVITGFVGTFLGGFLADRMAGEDRSKSALLLCLVSTVVAIPFGFWSIIASNPTTFFIANACAQLAIFFSTSPLNAVLLDSVPARTRATAMGMSIFVGHLLGDLISVWLVGKLSDTFGDLGKAMYVLAVSLIANAIAWAIAWRTAKFEEHVEPTVAA
ncbi:MAG: MFS transporter [Polyangiaceae bacterium]